jgi:hypothetical protein
MDERKGIQEITENISRGKINEQMREQDEREEKRKEKRKNNNKCSKNAKIIMITICSVGSTANSKTIIVVFVTIQCITH